MSVSTIRTYGYEFGIDILKDVILIIGDIQTWNDDLSRADSEWNVRPANDHM